MIQAQKYTQRLMQQNRGPRNKLMCTWSISLQQRMKEYTMGKMKSPQ